VARRKTDQRVGTRKKGEIEGFHLRGERWWPHFAIEWGGRGKSSMETDKSRKRALWAWAGEVDRNKGEEVDGREKNEVRQFGKWGRKTVGEALIEERAQNST